MARPAILPPQTPSELLLHVVKHANYPTTVVICWPREQFVTALAQDIDQQELSTEQHPLARSPLAQVAVARHIRMVFAPSVAHLRAFLATFTAQASRVPPPPADFVRDGRPPALVVYGHLEVHRGGREWSAQGLNASTALLVESAFRNTCRAVVVEPRRSQDSDELQLLLREHVPVLTGAQMRDDGSWAGRTVAVARVLDSWFRIGTSLDVLTNVQS